MADLALPPRFRVICGMIGIVFTDQHSVSELGEMGIREVLTANTMSLAERLCGALYRLTETGVLGPPNRLQ